MDRTATLSAYIRALFVKEMGERTDNLEMPRTISLDILEECHYAIKLVVRAIKNQKRTSWSVANYVQDLKKNGSSILHEQRRRNRFPPCGQGELISDCCVVADADGNILMWYLPGLVSPKRQKLVWSLLQRIEARLAIKYGSTNWRVNEEFYRSDPAFCYKSGTVSYSLAWFQQGMTTTFDMEVSAELRKPDSDAHQWLKAMEETSMILGAVVSIINPSVFETGCRFISTIQEHTHRVAKRENLGALLDSWTSPYTSASLMSNRDSPLHRDSSGGYSTMDLLLSIGNYSGGRFHVPGLGYDLLYTSGTVIGVSGRVLMHGATSSGERLCYAQWNKQNVLDSLDLPETRWVKIDDLVKWCVT